MSLFHFSWRISLNSTCVSIPIKNRAKMYCVIILKCNKVKLVIHSDWIQNYSSASTISNGLRNKTIRIFYSRDCNRPPNFHAPMRNFFSKDIAGCNTAIFLNAFGELQFHYIFFLMFLPFS